MQIPPAPEGWSLLLLLNTSSRRRGRGNVVIPKGFPQSVGRVVLNTSCLKLAVLTAGNAITVCLVVFRPLGFPIHLHPVTEEVIALGVSRGNCDW